MKLIPTLLFLLFVVSLASCACNDQYDSFTGWSRNGTITRLFKAYKIPPGMNSMPTAQLQDDWPRYATEEGRSWNADIFAKGSTTEPIGILSNCNNGMTRNILRRVTFDQCDCLKWSQLVDHFNFFLANKEADTPTI